MHFQGRSSRFLEFRLPGFLRGVDLRVDTPIKAS